MRRGLVTLLTAGLSLWPNTAAGEGSEQTTLYQRMSSIVENMVDCVEPQKFDTNDESHLTYVIETQEDSRGVILEYLDMGIAGEIDGDDYVGLKIVSENGRTLDRIKIVFRLLDGKMDYSQRKSISYYLGLIQDEIDLLCSPCG